MPIHLRKIRVALSGAAGRMGTALTELLSAQKDIELIGGIEAPEHRALGTHLGTGQVVSDLVSIIGSTDILVEFSTPQASLRHLTICRKHRIPDIIGTTGFTPKELGAIRSAAHTLPIAFAPNFSTGVTILGRLCRMTAEVLRDEADYRIIEFHHKAKKDAPSGTARRLAEIISQACPVSVDTVAVRAGDIVGEHTVIIATQGERLELTHKASSRQTFAQGVLRAVRFIIGRPAGLYDMEDILGLAPKRTGAHSNK